MTDVNKHRFSLAALTGLLPKYREAVASYSSLLGGSAGRLVFSLIYFLVLANTLSVAAFGVMAAASATGVVLSRVAGFGFSSPVYRIATVKPQLTGVFLGGYLALVALSLPLVAAIAYATYGLVFAGQLSGLAFALIIVSEVLLWRSAEIIIIVNNGFRRFALGAALTILGTFLRMCAALAFWQFAVEQSVEAWAWYYFAANLIALLMISIFGKIPYRLRFKWKLYPRRMRDALSVAGAEIIFYAQMELDKVLMLALAGGEVTGIYAVIMRLVDLTAIPLRSFNTLLVQALMRRPNLMHSWLKRLALEAGIATISTFALLAGVLLLWAQPHLLGKNIALVAPVLVFALAIPAARNTVEYHSELLYARGQTLAKAGILALIAGLKAGLMIWWIDPGIDAPTLLLWMSVVFAALYLISALMTHYLVTRPTLQP